MNEGHRRPCVGERQGVECRAVAAADDCHRNTGEAGHVWLNQIGHISSDRPLGQVLELASARSSGHQHTPGSVEVRCRRRPARRQDPAESPPDRAPDDHRATSMAGQSIDERSVSVRRRRHIADSVGDLVDLAADLVGGLDARRRRAGCRNTRWRRSRPLRRRRSPPHREASRRTRLHSTTSTWTKKEARPRTRWTGGMDFSRRSWRTCRAGRGGGSPLGNPVADMNSPMASASPVRLSGAPRSPPLRRSSRTPW